MLTTRDDAAGILRKDDYDQIVKSVTENSIVLKMGTRLRDMTAGELVYPVMESYPLAGFVDGDAGLKMTTNMKWSQKKMVAGEIAAIATIPDAVAADSKYDIFEQYREELVKSAGRVLDMAVLFGENKPTFWRDGIVPSATAAGNVLSATDALYDDIFGEDGIVAMVEEDGYFPTGIMAAMEIRAKLRGLKDLNERPLFVENMQNAVQYTLGGMQMTFPRNGAFDAKKALMITGDFSSLVYSIRQDITFDVFDAGVVSNDEGRVVVNLMQQDAKAIRMVMRIAWEVFNPLNAINEDEATRFPFAVYLPGATSYNLRTGKTGETEA